MTLNPISSARLADAVYGIRRNNNIEEGIAARMPDGLGDLETQFDIKNSSLITGRSGGRVFDTTSGFGLVMQGKGARKNEIAVTLRGTAAIPDWISNINIAVEGGPNGHLVHAGFNRIYKSLCNDILALIRGSNPSTIHCVGHSLGGALASLLAAELSHSQAASIKLYTFGSPRAGLSAFANDLTNSATIYRVFNISDPVPMIPLFPFIHLPTNGGAIKISTGHRFISADAHSMSTYTPAVENASWGSLKNNTDDIEDQFSVDHWLDNASRHISIPGSSLALYALGKALNALLKLARNVLGLTLTAGATLIDRLVMILHRAAQLSIALGERLVRLIRYIMEFVGRTVESSVQITTAFLNWIIGLLLQRLAAVAQVALARL